jgi:succinate-acetate transporter protein
MQNLRTISDSTANPAPLGLAGFGMTTLLLNFHNAGFFELNMMIVAMGIFYGGAAQIVAGIMEWKKNNTFGTIAFTSYGMFWLTLVAIWMVPTNAKVLPVSSAGMAAYLGLWGLFTLGLFFGTLKATKALQLVFASLVVLFALLAIATATNSHLLHTIAGYEGILCGGAALYTAMAEVLNEKYGRSVVPVG